MRDLPGEPSPPISASSRSWIGAAAGVVGGILLIAATRLPWAMVQGGASGRPVRPLGSVFILLGVLGAISVALSLRAGRDRRIQIVRLLLAVGAAAVIVFVYAGPLKARLLEDMLPTESFTLGTGLKIAALGVVLSVLAAASSASRAAAHRSS